MSRRQPAYLDLFSPDRSPGADLTLRDEPDDEEEEDEEEDEENEDEDSDDEAEEDDDGYSE